MSYPWVGLVWAGWITAIKLSDLVPSPLREKVRMRGNLKAVTLFDSPLTPTLSRKEREISFLT